MKIKVYLYELQRVTSQALQVHRVIGNMGNWVVTYGDINDDYASLGFTIGYKYIYNDKISVDAFIGGGRILWEARDNSYRGPAEFISGFNFGYRF